MRPPVKKKDEAAFMRKESQAVKGEADLPAVPGQCF
jgi:hypothetical protein